MDGFDHRLIEQLKRRVDEQHAAALRAITQLSEYLSGRDRSGPIADAISRTLGDLLAGVTLGESIRPAVLAAIANSPKTVSEIALETQLSEKQVRGVLYAKDLSSVIDVVRGMGALRFRSRATKSGSPAVTDEPPRKDSPPGLENTRRQSFVKPPI
jgi:hypothetical protein